MEINADFSKAVIVHAGKMDWVASPMKGVDRRMLDRIGDEVARATSIVRYAPGSHFSAHTHTGGEEFLVLQGVFQDEHGDFPAGTYVRNPPTSSHTPRSDDGCTIFVKLWQFDMEDRHQMSINTNKADWRSNADSDGIETLKLYEDDREHVFMQRWSAGIHVDLIAPGGMEILVTEGGFEAEGQTFEPQSWLRLPAGGQTSSTAGPQGCTVWIKRGHLKETPQAPAT